MKIMGNFFSINCRPLAIQLQLQWTFKFRFLFVNLKVREPSRHIPIHSGASLQNNPLVTELELNTT